MPEPGIGDTFQRSLKYQRGKLPRGKLDWANRPQTYKRYSGAPTIQLSAPQHLGGAPVWQVIQQRRSVRRFKDVPLTEPELSQLLWAAQGITQRSQATELRAAPSAGALYPVETYLALHNVEGIEPGIYHYAVQGHQLEQLQVGDFRAATARAALDQGIASTASAVFVWTAVFQRSKWKYGQRAYRYIYLDAGHIAQNVALGAVAMELGSCQIAALYDDEVNALIGVDGEEESVVYMTVVGRPG